jgi:hypothetical protein
MRAPNNIELWQQDGPTLRTEPLLPSEEELIDLNHRIVEPLRFLRRRAHSAMLEFKIGERVTFHPEDHSPVVGMITRYNKKTVTVITDNGQHWNVSPRFLRRVESKASADTANPKVIPLKRN